MGPDFLDRSLKTFSLVLLIFLPFGLYYFGLYPTIAVLSGAVWGIINILLLARLIRATIRPDGVASLRPVLWVLAGFVLLFVAGYYLLTVPVFEPWLLLIGFTGLFGIMFLKALGRVLTKTDEVSSTGHNVQKVL
jgi:hypothetical protein